jgi:hypothetical protein
MSDFDQIIVSFQKLTLTSLEEIFTLNNYKEILDNKELMVSNEITTTSRVKQMHLTTYLTAPI